MQANPEHVEALCSVLPILAYGDVSSQPWQDLTATDCIHFIQLAQAAVEYMLAQAHAAHDKLVSLSC